MLGWVRGVGDLDRRCCVGVGDGIGMGWGDARCGEGRWVGGGVG